MPDTRRRPDDHEPAWRRIASLGGRGWDDLCAEASPEDSYFAFERFLAGDRFATFSEGLARQGRSLEVGCGGGQLVIRLAGLGWDAWGVDFAETAVEIAARNATAAGVGARFRRADAQRLDEAPLPEQPFDLLVDNHMLHCIVGDAARRAVVEGYAALARSGSLVFTETMVRDEGYDAERYRIDPVSHVSTAGNRYLASVSEAEELWRTAGFELLESSLRSGRQPGEPADWNGIFRRVSA